MEDPSSAPMADGSLRATGAMMESRSGTCSLAGGGSTARVRPVDVSGHSTPMVPCSRAARLG